MAKKEPPITTPVPSPIRKNRSTDRQTLRIFWQASMQNKRLLAIAMAFPLGAIVLTVVVPFFIGRIIASLSSPSLQAGAQASQSDPQHYLPHLIIAALVGIALNRIGFPALLTFQAKTMAILQEKAFDGLMRRSVGFHNDNVGGKLVSDAIDYPSSFSALSDAIITNLMPFFLVLLTGSIIVIIESWQLGLVVLAMVVYAVGSAYYDMGRRSAMRLRRLATAKAVTGHIADSIVNVQAVKTFAHEPRELATHQSLNQKLLATRVEDWGSAARQGNNRITILMVMQLLFVIVFVRLASQDPSLLAIGIFAFSFIIMLSVRLFQVNIMLRQIEDGFLNASPLTEVLLDEPEILDTDDANELEVTRGEIDLRNIVFSYADSTSDKPIFSELSLSIKPGEKVGLVGPSGGGKSTLTRLLLRFEDIETGSIMIDGQDISSVTQSSLRRTIAYVPQEPLLFHRSIRENIAYGRPDASIEQVEMAARQAYADGFIRQLDEGYDTIVGERGVKLSGGQRQRIAIARAIVKDAPILLLDEATSALDSESETYIQKALQDLMQDRTSLVIAHRLSTVQKMDRIIVLENGTVTEEGSHTDLIGQNGTYAKLWNHQSGGFIED